MANRTHHMFVDVSKESDDFKIKLLPTSSCTSLHVDDKRLLTLRCNYYNGLKTNYVSVKISPNCDIENEKKKFIDYTSS